MQEGNKMKNSDLKKYVKEVLKNLELYNDDTNIQFFMYVDNLVCSSTISVNPNTKMIEKVN